MDEKAGFTFTHTGAEGEKNRCSLNVGWNGNENQNE